MFYIFIGLATIYIFNNACMVSPKACQTARSSLSIDEEDVDITEQKGWKIAKRVQEQYNGFGDTTSRIIMTLYNNSSRTIINRTLESKDEGDLLLLTFIDPKDVNGTVFLSHTKKKIPDNQWLYLPALKRIKRIGSANISGLFMGSEFAFEDLSSPELEKYRYEYLGKKNYKGQDCFLVKYIPVYEYSGYSNKIVWIHVKEYTFRKIQFYDRKKDLLKTLTYEEYKKHNQQFWRANVLVMKNKTTKKITKLEFKDWQFNTGQTDKDFEPDALKRMAQGK